jgi:hypothetical protein
VQAFAIIGMFATVFQFHAQYSNGRASKNAAFIAAWALF